MSARLRRLRRDDQGYVAVLVALLSFVLLAFCAFTVDVGRWYLVGLQEQRAADAAALAGVPNLPGDQTSAFSTAQSFAGQNGFANGGTVSVVPALGGQPTRLRVTITKTVNNFFAPLLGVPQTTIRRTAVADFVGPVPMGSPCNEFGNDPESAGTRSSNCTGTGQFWANVGSVAAAKSYGDAYQDGGCPGSDNCTGTTNNDYDNNGYFYSVTLSRAVNNLQFEAFDPALIAVGDLCDQNGLSGPVGDRYAPGQSSPYCTGDIRYGGTGEVTTQFTVRQATATSNPWDPTSYPAVGGCTNTYAGYNGSLSNPAALPAAVGSVFRKWVTLCSIGSAPAGTYFIQVRTNGLGTDGASGHNRFALRAYSTSDGSARDAISIAGFQKMAIYANIPSATTTFHLARIPSGAAGHILNVRLFDIGDSTGNGTVTVVSPSGAALAGCTGTGPASGTLSSCSITSNSSFNGKWETIAVPVPAGYTCADSDPTACWFKLQYAYGAGNQPSDTTSWTASLEGDPVRLVE
ncbi:pilus assembly protein TadG-related protein [Oryzihumus sp.]